MMLKERRTEITKMDAYVIDSVDKAREGLSPIDLQSLRSIAPDLSDECLLKMYKACNSIAQSKRQRSGQAFEATVADAFDQKGISYLSQVCIIDGRIARKKHGYHVYDFVLNAEYGDSCQDKIMISCKTSLRERYLQDQHVPCSKMVLITLDRVKPAVREKIARAGMDLVCIGEGLEFEQFICRCFSREYNV